MRKFRRVKLFTVCPYLPDIVYSGDTKFDGYVTVLESFNRNPQVWEEVFDKSKLFKLL